MFPKNISYQNFRNKLRNIVGIGLDEGTEAKYAGVEGGQLGLVFRLGSFLKLALLVASCHLAPDERSEVLQQALLGLRVQKL